MAAVSEEGIRVIPMDARTPELTYAWDNIARIDARVFDAGKTTILVVLGLLVLDGAREFSDELDNLFRWDD